jgi:hypothetical protein
MTRTMDMAEAEKRVKSMAKSGCQQLGKLDR